MRSTTFGKLGLRSKLFLVALGLITLSIAVAFGYARSRAEDAALLTLRADLVKRLSLVTLRVAVERSSVDEVARWDALADELGRAAAARVTLIGADGRVLGDSLVPAAEVPRVENHRGRPEVEAGLRGETRFSTRISETTKDDTFYLGGPVTFATGVRGVVRVAIPRHEVSASVAMQTRSLVLASGIAIVIALLLAFVAAELASRPMRQLTKGASRLAAGDWAARVPRLADDEFGKLGETLNALASGLSKTVEALRSERDRMEGILSSMEEGVLFLDRDGRIALVNPALHEMLLMQNDSVGRRLLEVVRHAELKELLDSVWDDDGEEEDGDAHGEIRLSGLFPRSLLVRARRLSGQTEGVVAIFLDVTETRRLEALRREFVANVSHELRTPVTSIRSAAETLHVAMEQDPRMATRFVEIIDRNAARLQALVEDLLDLSRIESRQYSLSLVAVEPLPALEHVVELFGERAARRRMRLSVVVPEGVPEIRADRRAFERILTNLVDNAVKYAGEGKEVRLSAEASGEDVVVTIADDGAGIEERHLARLFERFYRVDAGRSRDVGGTGLGLSIVKNLLESMGGTIQVESEVGRGTRFRLRLPALLDPGSGPGASEE